MRHGLWGPPEQRQQKSETRLLPGSLRDAQQWCSWTATIACIRRASKPRERVSKALNLPGVRCASSVSRESLWAATFVCRRTLVRMRYSRATMFSGSRIPRFDRSCWPSACRYRVRLFWRIGCLRQGPGCSGQDSALIVSLEWTTVSIPLTSARLQYPIQREQVVSDTALVQQHFRLMLHSVRPQFLPERVAELKSAAAQIEAFRQNVVLDPLQLESYVEAFNAQPHAMVWWSTVAYQPLKDMWMSRS